MNLHLGEDRKIRGGGEGVLIFVLLGGKKKGLLVSAILHTSGSQFVFSGLTVLLLFPSQSVNCIHVASQV